jgi:hypothetical protein
LTKLFNHQLKKIEIVYDHLAIFFKYSSLEQESLKKFVEKNDSYAVDYRKALLKHAEGLDKIRNLYSYFNSQTVIETSRLTDQINENSCDNFYQFACKQIELAKDLENIWSSLFSE